MFPIDEIIASYLGIIHNNTADSNIDHTSLDNLIIKVSNDMVEDSEIYAGLHANIL